MLHTEQNQGAETRAAHIAVNCVCPQVHYWTLLCFSRHRFRAFFFFTIGNQDIRSLIKLLLECNFSVRLHTVDGCLLCVTVTVSYIWLRLICFIVHWAMCVHADSAQGSICVYHMFTRRWLVCSWLIGSSTHKQHTRSSRGAIGTTQCLILPVHINLHSSTWPPQFFHATVRFKAHPAQSHYWPSEFPVRASSSSQYGLKGLPIVGKWSDFWTLLYICS